MVMTNNLQGHTEAESDRDNAQVSESEQNREGQSVGDDRSEDIHVVPSEDPIPEAVADVYVKDEIPENEISVVATDTGGDNAEVVGENPISENDSITSDSDAGLPAAVEEEVVSDNLSDNAENNSEKEKVDYTQYERKDMVERLRNLIEKGNVDAIREEIDALKYNFYRKQKTEIDEKRAQYVENGGVEEEYTYEEDEQELILKSLLNKYREMRNVQMEQTEAEKQHNLEEKLKIIEELKELVTGTESIGETFQAFRDLQSRWRNVGLVPQGEVKNLWETYHHFVEVFYDYIKINKELRDLDFKRNLEMKLDLCEKAEKLLLDESVVNAFRSLQAYHDQWREIGPVPKEMRVEIWERFKAASVQINKKHQEFFETQKEVQQKNLEAKEALCEKVEEIAGRTMTTMAQWEKNAKEVIEIQKLWNTIGYAAKKGNIKIYKRFHTLCDSFFSQKREFFGKEKAEQDNNLQLKEDLCVQAEALKDSSEWKSTTEDMIQLQKRWKEIGNVPGKYRESIWKRFRSACDHFFERKAGHFSSVDSEYENNLKAKRELIEKIQNFVQSGNPEESFEQLKDFQRQWSELGFVPIKYKKKIQDEYREAINKQFDALKLDSGERNRLRYKNKIEHLVSNTKSRNKLDSERDRLVRKYQQLQSDLVVWENNIGFFSKSKNSEAMIANVQRMIEQGRVEMKELEEKIKMIDSIENEEA